MNLLLLSKSYLLTFLFLLLGPLSSNAYSVLTHEAIVDATWEKSFIPFLKAKFPAITEEQLIVAHSYAYGGAIAPDMGYFPLGSKLFTDLVHYVRSGDLVNALLDEAEDANEYAFALGFLSHYIADKYGHELATNRTVPIVYPEMKQKFGNVVTYADDKLSHKRIEFAFDVLQIANGNYASKSYHDFIGFNISRSLLDRVVRKVYGLELNKIFFSFPLAVSILRMAVTSIFPALTQSAWVIKKDSILKLQPTATSRSFRNKMAKLNYYQEGGRKHPKPAIFAHVISWVIRVLPKVGPLKALNIKAPGIASEKLFIQSFDTVLVNCTGVMKYLGSAELYCPNINYDTGKDTRPGEYKPADINYDNLLLALDKNHFKFMNSSLKKNIIDYYKDAGVKRASKANRVQEKRIAEALSYIKSN